MEINYTDLTNRNIADILVITATPIESEALHKQMQGLCEDGLLVIRTKKDVYYAGVFGDYNIIHCQCGSMGTQDKYSSILTTHTALNDWPCIKAVIMLGIAFGMYEDDKQNPQHYSDVFVAEKIFPYENQRLNSDGSITYRGNCHYASNELLNAFTDYKKKWVWKNILGESSKIIIAPILSGEKLVDNLEFRNKLRDDLKEYQGGEMEGIGVAAVCDRISKPWILVKAICDFGDGNKGELKKEKQENAAAAAVDCCLRMLLSQGIASLVPRKSCYYYRRNNIELSNIFFITYQPQFEPFYLNRKIDEDLSPFIHTKNCWVFGKSGMGKSNLLYRLMSLNGIKYINVDCGMLSSEDYMEVFYTIMENICEINEVDCTVDESLTLNEILKHLSKYLDYYYPKTKIYILIDEIPFDFDSTVFKKFAFNLCRAIAYLERHLKSATVFFMLSSISSPVRTFQNLPELEKYSQHIKFMEVKEWSEDECVALIELLSVNAKLEWGDVSIRDFAKLKNYSPREIKNCMKEICALEVRTITQSILNKLSLSD